MSNYLQLSDELDDINNLILELTHRAERETDHEKLPALMRRINSLKVDRRYMREDLRGYEE